VSAPQQSVAERFKAKGLPVFQTEADAIAALNQFVSHLELMERAREDAAVHAPRMVRAPAMGRMLNEAQSLALMQEHGVPVVAHRLCHSATEAVEALSKLGAPVAVKGCSADIVHKTELNLVQLNVRT